MTKYPIVLVHGIMMKDVRHFKAFGRIEARLHDYGYLVYTANHDGLGSIENNAEQLKVYIEELLLRIGAEKVNIIAHSKGGLDALYMIDKLGMQDRVASVTFLSTPHKGSVIAEKLYELPCPVRWCIATWLNIVYRILGDKNPDALEACRQLRTNPLGVLELDHPHDGIYMQSFSTTLEHGRDDFIMGIPLFFSHHYEQQPSDGLVSKSSSRFRHYRGDCVEGSVSHSEIVDFMVKKKKKEKIYGFYVELAKELSEMGF